MTDASTEHEVFQPLCQELYRKCLLSFGQFENSKLLKNQNLERKISLYKTHFTSTSSAFLKKINLLQH